MTARPIRYQRQVSDRKQLMAGGGIIVIGTTLIPLLSGLF